MALISCDFFSDVLEVGTSMTVVLPQVTASQIGVEAGARRTDFPVLYLLHGLSDDHTAWLRYTSIERYAAAAGLAIVMPAVHRSFYADEARGHPYWTFVSEELPRIVREFFRVSTDPEDTYVAGLSMGGYGALKHVLTHPDRYGAAASLSGVVDVAALGGSLHRTELVQRVFDGSFSQTDDLFLLPANERFVAAARDQGTDVTVDFRPGIHEWGPWDRQIADVITWLTRTDRPT